MALFLLLVIDFDAIGQQSYWQVLDSQNCSINGKQVENFQWINAGDSIKVEEGFLSMISNSLCAIEITGDTVLIVPEPMKYYHAPLIPSLKFLFATDKHSISTPVMAGIPSVSLVWPPSGWTLVGESQGCVMWENVGAGKSDYEIIFRNLFGEETYRTSVSGREFHLNQSSHSAIFSALMADGIIFFELGNEEGVGAFRYSNSYGQPGVDPCNIHSVTEAVAVAFYFEITSQNSLADEYLKKASELNPRQVFVEISKMFALRRMR